MAAYSIDLRAKIFSAWENKEGSQRELAKRFKVSLSFVRDMLRRYRETNEIAALPQGGDRRSKLKLDEQELLKKMVKDQNDIYLREIQLALQKQIGVNVSISSLSRTLNRLNLGRKKTHTATEQTTERVKSLRYEWRRWLDTIDIRNLIFICVAAKPRAIDETGINIAMNRLYGRAEGGDRVHDDRPGNRGKISL